MYCNKIPYYKNEFLIEKMKNDSKVVTMIAAVPDSLSFSEEYRREAGKQFIDVGICEEHAISMAAGLAKTDVNLCL